MCEKLVTVRDFLYKFFIVGFLLFIFSVISYIFMKDFAVEIVEKWYGVDPVFYKNLVFTFLGYVKLFLVFFILTPALALHWMACCCKKKKEAE